MDDTTRITTEQLTALKEAHVRYYEALATKTGVPQAKTLLTNLLITYAKELISSAEKMDTLNAAIDDYEEENYSLSEGMKAQHIEIKELRAQLEELGATPRGRRASINPVDDAPVDMAPAAFDAE